MIDYYTGTCHNISFFTSFYNLSDYTIDCSVIIYIIKNCEKCNIVASPCGLLHIYSANIPYSCWWDWYSAWFFIPR